MTALPVEWVLVIFYGPSAHRATYGRLNNTKYTKDYIQLSRQDDFIAALKSMFPTPGGAGSVPLTYKWPLGKATGQLIYKSSDRPHLAWETSRGAPSAWKMSLSTSEATAETIPGDPTHLDFTAAENELRLLSNRGAGQPYLVAVKLQGEQRTLHLRAYLKNPAAQYAWSDIKHLPPEIQVLAGETSQRSALAWSKFTSFGTAPDMQINSAISSLNTSGNREAAIAALDETIGHRLAVYLEHPAHGLFFDPNRNHDAWVQSVPLEGSPAQLIDVLHSRFPIAVRDDERAEELDISGEEVEAFREQIHHRNYEVTDSHATVKTRGSAQRAFAEVVKKNYEFKCAVTGIETKEFLIAAHIVPWSADSRIRLDPSNGICLSALIDRAFEYGYLLIDEDLTIRVNFEKVGRDNALLSYLTPYNGKKLSTPHKFHPNPEYLQRRKALY